MLNRAVWIFFFDNLGVPGMHSPLCRQWASTWAWTVGFPGIRFSTYLNTFHKADFYLCSSVWCSGWTEKHPARALERVNNRTHAGFPFWPPALSPLSPPQLASSKPSACREGLWALLLAGYRSDRTYLSRRCRAQSKVPLAMVPWPGLKLGKLSPLPGASLRKEWKSQIQLKREHMLDRPVICEIALPLLPLWPYFPLIFLSSFGWLGFSRHGFPFPEVFWQVPVHTLNERGP